jgi:hypothetical protein
MSDTKKPAARISLYPISAAIWRNETQKGVLYNFTLERTYKDEKGKFKTTSNLNASDALLVAKIGDLVDTKVRELRAADRQAEQTEDETG